MKYPIDKELKSLSICYFCTWCTYVYIHEVRMQRRALRQFCEGGITILEKGGTQR